MDQLPLHYGAIKSTFTHDFATPPCAWCYRDAGLAWPEENPTSSICERHKAVLTAQSKSRQEHLARLAQEQKDAR